MGTWHSKGPPETPVQVAVQGQVWWQQVCSQDCLACAMRGLGSRAGLPTALPPLHDLTLHPMVLHGYPCLPSATAPPCRSLPPLPPRRAFGSSELTRSPGGWRSHMERDREESLPPGDRKEPGNEPSTEMRSPTPCLPAESTVPTPLPTLPAAPSRKDGVPGFGVLSRPHQEELVSKG